RRLAPLLLERPEAHDVVAFPSERAVGLLVDERELLDAVSDRHDQPSARRELVEERLRHLVRGRIDDDPVERRRGLVAGAPVSLDHVDPSLFENPLLAKVIEDTASALRERFANLDRVHLAREPAEERRLVARARADLEHLLVAAKLEKLEHSRDDRRLRRRLAFGDRERAVLRSEEHTSELQSRE